MGKLVDSYWLEDALKMFSEKIKRHMKFLPLSRMLGKKLS